MEVKVAGYLGGKLKGLTFFFPLSSGLSSRTPGDKPVAHVVGKSSEDGLGV